MSILKIDGKEYDSTKMSDQTKRQLELVQFADAEIRRLTLALALARTARNTYAQAAQHGLSEGLMTQVSEGGAVKV